MTCRSIFAIVVCAAYPAAMVQAADPAAPAEAQAAVPASPHTLTENISLATQYMFRGLSQTDGKPAIQGGVDYVHANGWYAGTWISNISWYTQQNAGSISVPVALGSPAGLGYPYHASGGNSASLEWDLYGGFKGSVFDNWSYDVGLIRYLYPGRYDNIGAYRNPDTSEAYVAGGYKWLTLKFSRAISSNEFGAAKSSAASYIDLTASVPVRDTGYTIIAHAGRQNFSGRANTGYWGNSGGSNKDYNYTDYKLGVTRDYAGFTFTVNGTYAATKSTGPDGETTAYSNAFSRNTGRGRVALIVTKNF
jgi:uncharacterized protein (TIGR02001 family)